MPQLALPRHRTPARSCQVELVSQIDVLLCDDLTRPADGPAQYPAPATEDMDIKPQPLILNRDLRVAHLPFGDVCEWDPRNWTGGMEAGRSDRDWEALWNFALTFDGYAYFGGDDGANDRLGTFATSVHEAHLATRQLPTIDLRMLRACLFFEQRRWCKWNAGEEQRCPPETAAYLQALLHAIRTDLAS